MKKYLLWLICGFRGHQWSDEATGIIGEKWDKEGITAKRYKCQRCKRIRFVRVENPSATLFPGE